MQDPNRGVFDKALTDLFTGEIPFMLGYILANEGVTPEMLEIKKPSTHDDYRKSIQKQAFERISAESKRGNLYATAYLGIMYAQGYGVKEDFSIAIEYYEKSAKGNNPLGCCYLGDCYAFDKKIPKGFKRDFSKAISYYEIGAAQNHSGCIANLGYLREEGLGFEKNLAEAKKFYKKAAQLGNVWALDKLTKRGQNVTSNPFIFFLPKNLDFTYEVSKETQPIVKGDSGYSVETTYRTSRITVKVTYTGSIDLGHNFTHVKDVSSNCLNWATLEKNYSYERTYDGGAGGRHYARNRALEANLVNYHQRKAIANIICEADSLISELIEKATAKSASVPYMFFQDRPTPAPQPQPLDPAQMLQIIQTLQQNPAFAQQVAILYQQFQTAHGSHSEAKSHAK